MKGVSSVECDIEMLRENLMNLIQAKGNLLDPEVIKASELLDKSLNDYNSIIFLYINISDV